MFTEEAVDISRLDRSKFDLITRFYDEMRSEDFAMPNAIDRFIPWLMFCSYSNHLEYAPRILRIGSESSQRPVFGEDWANKIISREKTPDIKMEKRSAEAYEQAAEEGFSAHSSEGIVMTDFGLKHIAFKRLIVAPQLPNGAKLFCVAGVLECQRLQ
ncbi:MAG: hypothetical protein AAF478_03455 [Pseudomonadota bacterium]